MSNTIIALLAAGKENCYRPEHPREPAQPIQTGLFTEEGESAEEKEEDWHRKLKKNAERKKLKSNALPTAKAL